MSYSRWESAVRRRVALVWIALLAASAAAAPPAHAGLFSKPSVQDQIKLGDQAAEQIFHKYRVIRDGRARRVEDVGQRLVDALPPAERGPWHYRFYVIDSKDVNAFALPGGNMFIFTGLYDRLHSEDELAAVMGHEMTHVRKEHWAKMYAAGQKRQIGLAVLLGLAHASSGIQNAAGLLNNLLDLRYSRKDEDQADQGGFQDMVAAGYNPNGMLDLFHTLQQAGGGGGGVSFLSDHPLTSARIQHTQERIDQLGPRNFPPMTRLD